VFTRGSIREENRRVRRAAVLALVLPLALAAGEKPEKPAARIVRSEQVVRLVVDAYVTDANGDPIPDLVPSDFVVKADGRILEVESAEFVAAGASEGPAAAPAAPSGEAAVTPGPPAYPPGRLIVLFLEGDIGRQRTKGLMRVRQEMFRLLDRLQPADRVAVVRFVSHLTVLCDFTADRAVLDDALRLGLGSSEDRDVRISPAPSLAANLDFAEARKAAHVERGLELVASALAPIPGAKAVVFAGWGFFANRAPVEGDLYDRALLALMRVRANVFTLDTSDADTHTLETTLQTASLATGGTYAKTHIFAGQAVDRVARALAGRWVLVCVAQDAAPHALDVALAGRRGDVVARAYTAAP
jgi:VWFA-related protein